MTYNSKNASGVHAQRASEVRANKNQAKLPWLRGLILQRSLGGGGVNN